MFFHKFILAFIKQKFHLLLNYFDNPAMQKKRFLRNQYLWDHLQKDDIIRGDTHMTSTLSGEGGE